MLESVANVRKCSYLLTYNFKAVISTGLKPSIAIRSLDYTCCKFHVPPISGLGMAIASVTRSQKSAVLCLTLEPHISDD